MDLKTTFKIIILVMLAMVVLLALGHWGIPWFFKKVSDLIKTAKSPNGSPLGRVGMKTWRTLAATAIVLWGMLAAVAMVSWRIFKFFLFGYQPDPPPDKRHA